VLRPQANPYRTPVPLDGLWTLTFDDDPGAAHLVGVPGSWNEQSADLRDHLGPAVYETEFDLPHGFGDRAVRLWFGSVHYSCVVECNGAVVGGHTGGHLPFALEPPALRAEHNRLVVRVDGRPSAETVPPGNLPPGVGLSTGGHPSTAFDFFPYCGIHRPVVLESVPRDGLRAIAVTSDHRGQVRVDVDSGDGDVRVHLRGHGARVAAIATVAEHGTATLAVPDPRPWSPATPHLYELRVELVRGGATVDAYRLQIGLRSVAVDGDRLLLNGAPVVLRGFGRHEDFPVIGRATNDALVATDHALMHWVGANSYRTTHYPYDERQLDAADRLGFLVISETPAVGLFFDEPGRAARERQLDQQLEELVARDRNHPSVIMWSLANEPVGGTAEHAGAFWARLQARCKELDPTRPTMVAGIQWSGDEPAFDHTDVVAVNRYQGWYTQPGRIADGVANFAAELDALHARYGKPVLVSEFGADAIAGHHALPPEMFSEEYQADLVDAYLDVCEARPWVIAHHVWNLCDFKTAQGITRAGAYNLKGVFTRDRRPKLAAHRLRARWHGAAP
jgi:beta-glucuronidase